MIKFRGKRIDNGEWVYGCYCNNTQEHWIFVPEEDDYTLVIPASIGMFTGLPDKNGKEIYGSIPINGVMSKGGDVFVINKDDDEWTDNVIWIKEQAKFELSQFRSPVTDISLIYASKSENCEVLSPIYEKEQTDNPRIIDDGYPFTNLKPTYGKGEIK